MIQLFLVRHGESPFAAASDHQRTLSDLGAYQATQAGQFIKRQYSGPYHIICSDARRTRMTAQIIDEEIGAERLAAFAQLYHARVGDWCDHIQPHSSPAALVLVGHNPTMSQLAKYLLAWQAPVFSPACVAHYQLEIAEDGLKLPATLIDFFSPDAQ